MDQSLSHTSATLLERLKNSPSDQDAWERFVDRYGPRIYAWCLRWNLQKADAEDVTQIVLVKLAEKMRSFVYDPARSFRSWLKTVTHHAWQDFVTSRKPGQQGAGDSSVQALLNEKAAPESLQEHLEEEHRRLLMEEAMRRVQARVEPHTWEAFRLLTYDKLSGQQTARKLGLAVSAVFMAKSRIVQMLRDEVESLDRLE